MKVTLAPALEIEAEVLSVGQENTVCELRPKVYNKRTTLVTIANIITRDAGGDFHFAGRLRVNVKTGVVSVAPVLKTVGEMVCPMDEGIKGVVETRKKGVENVK